MITLDDIDNLIEHQLANGTDAKDIKVTMNRVDFERLFQDLLSMSANKNINIKRNVATYRGARIYPQY